MIIKWSVTKVTFTRMKYKQINKILQHMSVQKCYVKVTVF